MLMTFHVLEVVYFCTDRAAQLYSRSAKEPSENDL